MIAIDAMGGDFAPKAILEGALIVARNNCAVRLFGPRKLLEECLYNLDSGYQSYPITFHDSDQVIEMDEDPVRAVRKKNNSSLVLAVLSVKRGECSGVVSAGNSGAFLAATTLILGRKNGIKRPAIAGYLPARQEPVLCLDLGANIDCKASYLFAFAHMGSDYYTSAHGIACPRIGLLSNGAEKTKGNALIKKVHAMLVKSQTLNFIGNVEPIDVFNNVVDVVVCDGFAGNLLLKTAEGMADLVASFFTEELSSATAHSKEHHNDASQHFEKVFEQVDWKKRGGALLLGVLGTAVVVHGRADAEAIKNAILLAQKTSGASQVGATEKVCATSIITGLKKLRVC